MASALSSRMRIIVTGANGFVGRHLTAALAKLPDNPQIIGGVHRTEVVDPPCDLRFVQLDVTDPDQVDSVIAAEQPTHLIHLAAISAVALSQNNIRQTWLVNLRGTLNISLAISNAAPDCRLIYCSSAEVYGASFRSERALDETALPDPVSPYGASKAAADLMIGQMARGGLRAVRVRPFNHTGAAQSANFVVPAFAAQIARIERGKQEPIIRVGNLSNRRDFLDVEDVVDAYCRIIARFDTLVPGCTMNLASGQAIAIADILDALVSMSSAKIEVVQDEAHMRSSDTSVMLGDATLARRLLDWAPKRDLMSTFRAVLDYYRAVDC
jgi:GDP-4-dehydro-6-deoxy-D-mannose reductase